MTNALEKQHDHIAEATRVSRARPTVLVIDDDAFVTTYVSAVLNRIGYRAVVANCAFMGLARTLQEKPACILLDLDMPQVSGFDVLEQKKAIVEIADIPVLVLSANRKEEDVRHALQLGAKGYVAKPIDDKILTARLAKFAPPAYRTDAGSAVSWL